MTNIQYFIGPMTKNVVDVAIEYANNTGHKLALIPSRRQIEFNGGYVNNWTTSEFAHYVRSKTNNILLVRDHAGPGQGQIDDDGYVSLAEDCNHLDVIHIDPWKKYPTFELGLYETIRMIQYCYEINPNIEYEIGTEQSIRKFESYELDELVCQLKSKLPAVIFNQIKYLVIQSGTSLNGNLQTGQFDPIRLQNMLSVCKKHNLISKEHNGDYIPVDIIKQKFDLGLHSINIAPEFGLIETQTYLDRINTDNMLEELWNICYQSGKWKKWVTAEFDPLKNKTELIQICGHYVVSVDKFLGIKNNFPYIDSEIQKRIYLKLKELNGN